jgi:hypothetical protein
MGFNSVVESLVGRRKKKQNKKQKTNYLFCFRTRNAM